MNNKRRLRLHDLVFIGVLSAMCTIATTIKIPFGVGAMIHLGSAMIYTTGIVFGGVYAGLAGALGSALFDAIMGYSPYTLWSFIIKGIAGFIVGVTAKGLWPDRRPTVASILGNNLIFRSIVACLLGAAWTLAGYLIAWWQVTGSWAVAVSNAPGSVLTSGTGFVIALLLAPRLRKAFNR